MKILAQDFYTLRDNEPFDFDLTVLNNLMRFVDSVASITFPLGSTKRHYKIVQPDQLL